MAKINETPLATPQIVRPNAPTHRDAAGVTSCALGGREVRESSRWTRRAVVRSAGVLVLPAHALVAPSGPKLGEKSSLAVLALCRPLLVGEGAGCALLAGAALGVRAEGTRGTLPGLGAPLALPQLARVRVGAFGDGHARRLSELGLVPSAGAGLAVGLCELVILEPARALGAHRGGLFVAVFAEGAGRAVAHAGHRSEFASLARVAAACVCVCVCVCVCLGGGIV